MNETVTPLEALIEVLREMARMNEPAHFEEWENEQEAWWAEGCAS